MTTLGESISHTELMNLLISENPTCDALGREQPRCSGFSLGEASRGDREETCALASRTWLSTWMELGVRGLPASGTRVGRGCLSSMGP